MSNEFTCSMCKATFEKAWTDEEAHNEMLENFGELKESQKTVICDDCYNEFMEWFDSGRSKPQ